MYPIHRNRRLRSSESLRVLLQETYLSHNDFIVPLFIIEGNNREEKIPSMPSMYVICFIFFFKFFVWKMTY